MDVLYLLNCGIAPQAGTYFEIGKRIVSFSGCLSSQLLHISLPTLQ
jgi:hypothetical protein